MTNTDNKLEEITKTLQVLLVQIAVLEEQLKVALDVRESVEKNTTKITNLTLWKYGMMAVLTAGGIVSGVIMNLIVTNLEMSIDKRANDIFTERIKMFEEVPSSVNINKNISN